MKKNDTIYQQLKDKEWLYRKYVLEKNSLSQIQKEINCKSHNSVRQALIRFGIQVRNTSDGLTVNNQKIIFNKCIIDGCLLGDAGLEKYNKLSENSYPSFYKKNIHLDHIKYIAKFFYPNDYQNYIRLEKNKLNNKIFPVNVFSTRVSKDFIDYYNRWYPKENNFIKVIPRDIEITPLLLLNWFMDDGSSTYRKRLYKGIKQIRKKQIIIILSTNCFNLDDQLFLCHKINQKFNLNCKPTPVLNTFVIKISQSKVKDFYDIIGNTPVQSMQYKWK